jgi:hypothetical protein
VKSIFIGVDPGISGAISFYRPPTTPYEGMVLTEGVVEALQVHDMPLQKLPSGKSKIDAVRLQAIIEPFAPFVARALVEDVGAMPYRDSRGQLRGQGAAHSFAFGYSCGLVIGLLEGLGIHPVLTKAAIWKTQLKLSRDKDLSRYKAQEIFPHCTDIFSRKKDDGRAESALLAYLAAKLF